MATNETVILLALAKDEISETVSDGDGYNQTLIDAIDAAIAAVEECDQLRASAESVQCGVNLLMHDVDVLTAERDQLQGAAEELVLCLDPIYDWDEIERQADGGTRHAYKELKRLLPDKAYHQPESTE